jgi:pimeloyl-ACP methyl ester carboxylesterase
MSEVDPAPASASSMVDHDVSPIAWREAGQGDLVVFLHGMPGSRTAWDDQINHLMPGYRCVAWDMPGYGASSPIDPQSDFPVLLDALEEFVRVRLKAEKAHLVGLSLGGIFALHAAARGDGYVRSITVLDASPCFGFDGGSDPDEFVSSVVAGLDEAPSIAEFAAAIVPTLLTPSCPPELVDAGKATMERATRQGLELSARLLARHDIRDRLDRIAVPALIMAGEHDQDTPLAYAEYLAEKIAGAKLACVPDAAHFSNLENAAFVNAAVEEFLRSV